MGVVYHSNYLVWMEVGRVELCRASGLRYKEMEEVDKIFLAVVEVNCRYSYPARYDEEVIVRTWISEANLKVVKFGYEMLSAESGKKLCSASSTHVFCGAEMRSCKLPQKYWDIFGVNR